MPRMTMAGTSVATSERWTVFAAREDHVDVDLVGDEEQPELPRQRHDLLEHLGRVDARRWGCWG